MPEIHQPARLATRAASFRYGGRHHPGIPGGIIPLYPGGFLGIGISAPVVTIFPVWMAEAGGFYAKEGLKVEVINMEGGTRGLQVLREFRLAKLYYSSAGLRDGIIADLAARGVGRELSQLDADGEFLGTRRGA